MLRLGALNNHLVGLVDLLLESIQLCDVLHKLLHRDVHDHPAHFGRLRLPNHFLYELIDAVSDGRLFVSFPSLLEFDAA